MGATMMWRALRIPLIATALSAAPASAQMPISTTSYGPGEICVSGYAFSVAADEAVRLAGDGAPPRLLSNSAPQTYMHEEAARDDRRFRHHAVRLANGTMVERRDYRAQGGYVAGIPGEAVYAEIAAHREYILPAASAGGHAVRVVSDVFFGRRTNDDLEVLNRISQLGDRPCAPLIGAEPANWATLGYRIFSPLVVTGPGQVCSKGLAIALAAGDRARISLKERSADPTQWLVESGGVHFLVSGDQLQDSPPRTGAPLSLGYQVEWLNGAALSLRPPAPSSGERRRGYIPSVTISAPGANRAALLHLVDRLNFVGMHETRCWQ